MELFFSFITPIKNPKKEDINNLFEDLNNLQRIISPKKIELIIINYKSEKEIINFLNNLKKDINFVLKIFSLNEAGIYKAYNFGFKQSSGIWNIFIGCDDRILFHNIFNIIKVLESLNFYNIISCPSIRLFSSKKILLKPEKLLLFFKNSIPHPSTFINKKIKVLIGNNIYPTKYKIAGDYYFFLKCFLNKNIKIKNLKNIKPLIAHNAYGTSSNISESKKEILKIQKELLGLTPYSIIQIFNQIRRFFVN